MINVFIEFVRLCSRPSKNEYYVLQKSVVDEKGCYTEEAGKSLVGLDVLSEGNSLIMNWLQDDILHKEDLVHSYPYDWRTKKPVIIRSSEQWFIDTAIIKENAIVSTSIAFFFFFKILFYLYH